jgi:hypothetical protein
MLKHGFKVLRQWLPERRLRNRIVLIGVLVMVAAATSSCVSPGSDWVEAHNKYRCMHGVPPLSWNADYADVAEWRATNCQHCAHCTCEAPDCQPQYAKQYAENATCYPATAQQAVDAWYSEIQNYDYSNPKWSSVDPKTGHFINVVVSTAKYVGCFCANQQCYCDYDSMYGTAPATLSQLVPEAVNSEQFCQGATYSTGTGWTK